MPLAKNMGSSSPINSPPRSSKNKSRKLLEEIPGYLRVFSDGSVDRCSALVTEVPPSHGCHDHNVCCKDVSLNPTLGTWARLYAPKILVDQPKLRTCNNTKASILFYFHGGGFCVGSTSWSTYHIFLCRLCSEAKCIIVSVNYRLAPENRLPAAYEDCWYAIKWCSSEEWLQSYGNFSRCFLAGDSAGANIAHHLTVISAMADLEPLRIVGVVLIQPFFGRECHNRTKSEVEATDPALKLEWTDVFWRLSLPVGASKDHPACNPLGPKNQYAIKDLELPPILLLISEGDVMRDIDLEYYRVMRKAKKKIKHVVYKGVGHGFQVLHPNSHRACELRRRMAMFIVHP